MIPPLAPARRLRPARVHRLAHLDSPLVRGGDRGGHRRRHRGDGSIRLRRGRLPANIAKVVPYRTKVGAVRRAVRPDV